jgi:hypothetical protein
MSSTTQPYEIAGAVTVATLTASLQPAPRLKWKSYDFLL